jgi:hypothetical protein
VIGVQYNKPSAIDMATEVAVGGGPKCMAGAAVAIGAQLMSDASGRAITATSTNRAFGIALAAAAGAGEIIPIRMNTIRPLVA